MSRTVHPDVLAELDQSSVSQIIMVDLDFPAGMVYAHSAVGDIVFNGNTYLGVGDLGGISEIEESGELQAWGVQLELNGLNPALVSIALQEHIQGRAALLRVAFLNPDTLQIIGEPIGPWTGRMDTLDGQIGEKNTLTLSIENRLADWERPRTVRYTNAEQQAQYPGDLGFEFVSEMPNKELVWGPR